MEQESDGRSPISGVAPPIHGRWQPGQSGNPKGRPSQRAYKEALMRQLALAAKDLGLPPERALDIIAAPHVVRIRAGDMMAIKEGLDRIDGKVPQSHGQDEDLGPVQLTVTWKREE